MVINLQLFQSTLPRRERRRRAMRLTLKTYFNPRSREGSDDMQLCKRGTRIRFQSTLPRRERQRRADIRRRNGGFQSTLPRRERPTEAWKMFDLQDFNPRSREGSDLTSAFKNKYKNDFNPRSREGSDYPEFTGRLLNMHFNPRSREGSDEKRPHRFDRLRISIHAPAKGATVSTSCPRQSIQQFQSTLPRRERQH